MKSVLILMSLLSITLFSVMLYGQPAQWESRGVGGGGALFGVSINPGNEDEFYVACDMGELFHTTNSGRTYELLDFRQIQGGPNTVVRCTYAPPTRYAISYKPEGLEERVQPVVSEDYGKTWSPFPGNPDPTEETFYLFADYAYPSRVIYSTYSTVYYTENGGQTVSDVYQAADGGAGIVLGGAFFGNDLLAIGTNDGVLVSTDGGASFSIANIPGIPAGEHIWSFAGARLNGITRFFCITGDSPYAGMPGSDYYEFAKGVYKLDYGTSSSWAPCTTGIDLQTDFVMFVGTAQDNINTVYLAGSNVFDEPDILKSTNAGASWEHVFQTENNQNIATGWSGDGGDRGWSYGECPFGFSVSLFDANKLAFSDFGYVHFSSDGGATWQQAYTDRNSQNPSGAPTPKGKSYSSIGLENTTCWQVFWIDKDNLFACYSDIRGIRSTDAGKTWSFDYTGHASNSMYRIVKHPATGTLYAGVSSIHDVYQSTRLADNPLNNNDPGGKIIYSADKGKTWSDLRVFNHPVFWLALDPGNPNRMYASVIHSSQGGIYVTNTLDQGPTATWTKLPDPPRTEGHPASINVLSDGSVVCTFSGRRAPDFTASSGVFIYTPSSNSWVDVSDPGMHYWTKDLVVDPTSEDVWLVAVFSGWGGAPNGLGGLYRTTNRGSSWQKINALDRVTSCTFAPSNPNELYLTTEIEGLWISRDMQSPNPTFSQVPSYMFRQPERVFFNPFRAEEMWITSFGNGMNTGVLQTTGIETTSDLPSSLSMEVYPNPASSASSVRLHCTESETVRISLWNALGSEIAVLFEGVLRSTDMSIPIGRHDLPPGLYYVQAVSGKSVSTVPLTVIR